MFVDYLTRGVKAGLVAGLVFGLFVAAVANPLVAYADEQNHAAEDSHGHSQDATGGAGSQPEIHHDAAVSKTVTRAASGLSAVLWAILLGGLVFGLGYYILEPAIPGTGSTKSYVLGAAGFVTVSGAPWLVLPPAAPGAAQSLPTETRLLVYGGMMAAGALTCLLAGYVYNRFARSRSRETAALAAVLPLGLLAIPTLLAPTNTVEGALPPELRAGLTGLFVFGQVLLWLLLAGVHAQLSPTDDATVDVEPSRADSGVTAG